MIDVSTLGKLLVRGPDAGELLDRLYPNRFSNLKPGRIRYGVMTSRRRPDHGRRHDLPARRRHVLRHDDVERRGRDRGVVRLVARDLGPRRARHRRHAGAVRRQPRRAAGARDPRRADRPRRQRRRASPTSTASQRQGRGRRRAAAADRLRRRGRLRDPLPVGLRRARLGRARRGGRAAVRPRAAAHPAAAEAARDRRPGHGLGVDALRRRDAVDRQARQGAGLHRPLGARARVRASGARTRSSASRWPTGTSRSRARSSCPAGR